MNNKINFDANVSRDSLFYYFIIISITVNMQFFII